MVDMVLVSCGEGQAYEGQWVQLGWSLGEVS